MPPAWRRRCPLPARGGGPVGGEALAGEELPVEVLEAVHAADDLGEAHALHAAVALALRGDALPHLVVGDEIARAAGEDGAQVGEEAVLAGPFEVVPDLVLEGAAHGEAAVVGAVAAG